MMGRRGITRCRDAEPESQENRPAEHSAASWAGTGKLATRAGRAVGFSFVNSALAKLGTVGLGILLARLLGPQQFGIYAVGYVAMRVQMNLNDLGVSLAIVRWPGRPGEIAPTVATVTLITGSILYAGCYLAAPFYASALGAPAAAGVVRVLCLAVVFDSVAAAPGGLLQRAFRQDVRLFTDQSSVWLGVGLTGVLAWLGYGAMSLAIGRVVGSVAGLFLLAAFAPEPLRFGFNPAVVRELLRFSLPLAGSGIIVFAVINVDQLLVGQLLGATALGFFVLASNLAGWPLTVFAQPVRSVAPAAFARLQHQPAAMRRGFLSFARLLGAIALPACLSISGLAVPLIRFVYGAKWLLAADALRWLAVLAALQIACELSYDYFVVLAKARVIFTLQLVWLLVLVPAFAAGALTGGIRGAAIAETLVAAALPLPWYLRELRLTGIRGRVLAGRLRLPFLGAAFAWGACLAVSAVAPNDLAAFAASGLMAGLVISLLMHRMRREVAWLRGGAGPRRFRAARAPAPAPAPAPVTDSAARLLARAARVLGPPAGAPAAAPARAEVPGAGHVRVLAVTGTPLTEEIPAAAGNSHGPAGPASRPVNGWACPAAGRCLLPLYRHLLKAHLLAMPLDERLPVYRQTISALRWDPGDSDEPAASG
jgi:PST family polysaccharide transporter